MNALGHSYEVILEVRSRHGEVYGCSIDGIKHEGSFYGPEAAERYALGFIRELEDRTYRCPRCGRTSYNPNDARERYCGACKSFEG